LPTSRAIAMPQWHFGCASGHSAGGVAMVRNSRALLTGLAICAGLMYFMDPERGSRFRALDAQCGGGRWTTACWSSECERRSDASSYTLMRSTSTRPMGACDGAAPFFSRKIRRQMRALARVYAAA
jgi:hypothetical protein